METENQARYTPLLNNLNRKTVFIAIFAICFISNGLAALFFGYQVNRLAATESFKVQAKQTVILEKGDLQEGDYGRYVSSTKRFFSTVGENVGIWIYSSLDQSDIIAVDMSTFERCSRDAFEKVVTIGQYYQFCQNLNGIVIQINKEIRPIPAFQVEPLQLTVSLITALVCSLLLSFLMKTYFAKLLKEITSFLVSPKKSRLGREFNWLEKPILQLFQTIGSLKEKLLEKEKAEVLAKGIRQISHDLGSPISGMNVLVDKLDQEKSNLTQFSRSVLSRLENLAADLSERSRIKVENIESFDIYKTLVHAIEIIKEQLGEVTFEASIQEKENVQVYGNNRHFCRIIECLVQNSLEAEMASRKLVVGVLTNESDLYVTVQIKDNGKGMSKENLNLVTLSGVSIGKEGIERSGSGLGLSFAFEKAEEWGGSAKIESQIDKGTIVELNFLKV